MMCNSSTKHLTNTACLEPLDFLYDVLLLFVPLPQRINLSTKHATESDQKISTISNLAHKDKCRILGKDRVDHDSRCCRQLSWFLKPQQNTRANVSSVKSLKRFSLVRTPTVIFWGQSWTHAHMFPPSETQQDFKLQNKTAQKWRQLDTHLSISSALQPCELKQTITMVQTFWPQDKPDDSLSNSLQLSIPSQCVILRNYLSLHRFHHLFILFCLRCQPLVHYLCKGLSQPCQHCFHGVICLPAFSTGSMLSAMANQKKKKKKITGI